jgi:hypothetical protein
MDNANMTCERSMHRAKLLDRQPLPVRSDVFIHNLDSYTLEALRRALAQGLTLSGLDFTGDDGAIVILRFTRR